MVQIKVTKKEMETRYKNIIRIGYCDAQYLLQYQSADFYTSGVYGWKSDIYKIDNNTIISTGYAPLGNISNYELTKKYDKKAREIVYNYMLSYEQKSNKVNKLLKKYVQEMLREG